MLQFLKTLMQIKTFLYIKIMFSFLVVKQQIYI